MASDYEGSYTGIEQGKVAYARDLTNALNKMERVANKVTTAEEWDIYANKISEDKYPACNIVSAAGAAVKTSMDTQLSELSSQATAVDDATEKTANKVTSGDWADNKEDDNKYPSCKAVDQALTGTTGFEQSMNIIKYEYTEEKNSWGRNTRNDLKYPSCKVVNTVVGENIISAKTAEVEGSNNLVNGINTSVDDSNASVDDSNASVDDINASVDNINASVDKISEDIEELDGDTEKIANKVMEGTLKDYEDSDDKYPSCPVVDEGLTAVFSQLDFGKITSVSADSTDILLPTAGAVYRFVQSIIGVSYGSIVSNVHVDNNAFHTVMGYYTGNSYQQDAGYNWYEAVQYCAYLTVQENDVSQAVKDYIIQYYLVDRSSLNITNYDQTIGDKCSNYLKYALITPGCYRLPTSTEWTGVYNQILKYRSGLHTETYSNDPSVVFSSTSDHYCLEWCIDANSSSDKMLGGKAFKNGNYQAERIVRGGVAGKSEDRGLDPTRWYFRLADYIYRAASYSRAGQLTLIGKGSGEIEYTHHYIPYSAHGMRLVQTVI
ncbi:hypothetical protein NO1_0435 [Candidatus Termititenax aidoneus]|uniref:Uncharacterized protein n=1 Tax=Termititenax aidoneus TaxID=2218524 RepID=A0A388TB87_TERA1|nr:hypothetical protein NO1_0435 [Candidatus Termititenax aidoneus]